MNSTARLERRTANPQENPFGPRWLRIAFWFCTAIAIAAVLRRCFALANPPQSGPPQLVALDAEFASHAALTLAHILPALAFVLLAPLVFMRRFAGARSVDRVLYPLGVIVGVTAYAMSGHPVGGWVERSAVLLFDTLFLFSLARSFLYWQRGEARLKIRWLTRAIGILLGIATTRPVMGMFFVTSQLTHLAPRQFFGIAFWIGFSINTVAVELWLRTRQGQTQIAGLARSV